jgi:hypothetical protein
LKASAQLIPDRLVRLNDKKTDSHEPVSPQLKSTDALFAALASRMPGRRAPRSRCLDDESMIGRKGAAMMVKLRKLCGGV